MENTFKGSKNYVASPELMNAVNIAMALKKPLLIKGEPGTGKTMLAEAVAEAQAEAAKKAKAAMDKAERDKQAAVDREVKKALKDAEEARLKAETPAEPSEQ